LSYILICAFCFFVHLHAAPLFAGSGKGESGLYSSFERNAVVCRSCQTDSYQNRCSDSLSLQTRSLLVPGWGQLSSEEYIKGGIFLGTALSSLGLTIYYNERGNSWYSRYEEATDSADIREYRKRTEDYDIRRNQMLFVFALNYLINMVDIYWESGVDEHGLSRRITWGCMFSHTSSIDTTEGSDYLPAGIVLVVNF